MKKTVRALSLFIALLMLLTFVSCKTAVTEVVPPDRPAMWEATDSKTNHKIYLFGSIHVAEEALYPLDDAIMDAFSSSEYLAVEVDLLAFAEDTAQQVEYSQALIYTDGRVVTDEIDEDVIHAAATAISEADLQTGIPEEYLKMMKPYAWQSLLSEVVIKESGLAADQGLDMHFLTLAREQDKEVLEVESMESQMSLLNGFSPEIQTILIEQGTDIETGVESMKKLYSIWKSGDMDALLEYARSEEEAYDYSEEEIKLMENYNDQLITQRNNLMADTAEEYIQDGKTVFYVVGALHMVGKDGIVEQLMARGYTLKRV